MAYDVNNDFGVASAMKATAGYFKHYDRATKAQSIALDRGVDNKIGYNDFGPIRDGLTARAVDIVVIPAGDLATGDSFVIDVLDSDTLSSAPTHVIASATFSKADIKDGTSFEGMKCVIQAPDYHKRFLYLKCTPTIATAIDLHGYIDIGAHSDYAEHSGV